MHGEPIRGSIHANAIRSAPFFKAKMAAPLARSSAMAKAAAATPIAEGGGGQGNQSAVTDEKSWRNIKSSQWAEVS